MKKSKKNILLLGALTLAFNVNNVYAQEVDAVTKLKENVVTSGAGLYQDTTFNDYIFKGKNPNNYLLFNNELWRIMSINSDGTLKIMKAKAISGTPYDTPIFNDDFTYNASSLQDTRYSANSSDYCYSSKAGINGEYYGCKIWGSNKTLYDKNKNPITKTKYDNGADKNLPNKDSALSIYLNGDYYNTLSDDAKTLIIDSWFNVGPFVGPFQDLDENEPFSDEVTNLESVKWFGKIGITELENYKRTSANSSCKNLVSLGASYACVADIKSYIYEAHVSTRRVYTMNSYNDRTYDDNYNSVMLFSRDGDIGNYYPCNGYEFIPTLTIRSNLKFVDGDGTETNPYVLEKKYTISTKVVNGNGTISQGGIVKKGDNYEVTFTPNNDYVIENVLLNDSTDVTNQVVDNKLLLEAVDSNIEVSVTYKKIENLSNNNTNNPETGDNIFTYITVLLLSVIMLVTGKKYIKKENKYISR